MVTIVEKFTAYYENHQKNTSTNSMAYDKAVDEWEKKHGCLPPYKDFESFRVAKNNAYKKNRAHKRNNISH